MPSSLTRSWYDGAATAGPEFCFVEYASSLTAESGVEAAWMYCAFASFVALVVSCSALPPGAEGSAT